MSSRRGEMGGNYEIVVKYLRLGEICLNSTARFNFPEGTVELYAEKVQTRGLCAIAQVDLEHTSNKMFCRHKLPLTFTFHQAESLRYKLIGGLAVRRACYGVLRFIMESGAKGCEVMMSHRKLFSQLFQIRLL